MAVIRARGSHMETGAILETGEGGETTQGPSGRWVSISSEAPATLEVPDLLFWAQHGAG